MRLTEDKKRSILARAVTATLAKRRKALRKESNELALLAYNHIYQQKDQELMNIMPAGFMHEKSNIYFQQDGFPTVELVLTSSMRTAACDQNWHKPCYHTSEENAITKRIRTFVAAEDKIKTDETKLRESLRLMLAGITTLKRLEEEWPEGKEYYMLALPDKPLENVPAVRGAAVSKLILELGE